MRRKYASLAVPRASKPGAARTASRGAKDMARPVTTQMATDIQVKTAEKNRQPSASSSAKYLASSGINVMEK